LIGTPYKENITKNEPKIRKKPIITLIPRGLINAPNTIPSFEIKSPPVTFIDDTDAYMPLLLGGINCSSSAFKIGEYISSPIVATITNEIIHQKESADVRNV
ncbi:hypothetical protein AF319_15940, partial [Listeria monocytogenes]|nr:hypothetical protein [Listeria monocytogenes]